jgi:high-affinity iron transporter
VLASFVIGLREGLEATLVVTILVAFLVKSQRRRHLRLVWLGVSTAVALSVGLTVLLVSVEDSLDTHAQQELFDAIASLVAVVFVTWMIFWMRRAARGIKGELQSKLDEAIKLGPVAVVAVAFIAVAREGVETGVLAFAALRGSTGTSDALIGILLGLAAAVVVGWLLYFGAVRINLGTFFTWTGVLLIFVAAGILRYSIHDFQEAGVLGMGSPAFDLSDHYDKTAVYDAVVSGMFNLVPAPTWPELIGYLGYLIPVMVFFLVPGRRPAKVTKPAKVTEPAESTEVLKLAESAAEAVVPDPATEKSRS